MDPLLILSPHLDDAVLSVGQVLAGRPNCIVATMFTGDPPPTAAITTYDQNCGFRGPRHAMAVRRREDRAAMQMLGARSAHLGLLDHQYRGDVNPDEDRAVEGLVTLIEKEGVIQVAGPLGLAHPDHAITARVYGRVLREVPTLEGWLYEDLPSRILWPEQVPASLYQWSLSGWAAALDFLGTGPIEKKARAIDCYGSQLWALDRHAVLCPERLWRLTPCDSTSAAATSDRPGGATSTPTPATGPPPE